MNEFPEQVVEDNFKRRLAEEHASVLAGLAPQTMVITREGEVPVEWLCAGDEVLTRDRGFEPIEWINRTRLTRSDLREVPQLAPVRIKAGSIDAQSPTHDMVVSPRQLLLVRSYRAELDFESSEVLVPALSIGEQVDPEDMHWNDRVSFAQVLLSSHHMMLTDGAWVGSLFTGRLGEGLDKEDCPLVGRLDRPRMMAARPVLDAEEGHVLMSEIWRDRAAREAAEAPVEVSDVG